MPKTSPIIALGASFLAIFGSLAIFAPAEAATILVDDFNSYSDGSLTGQGGWDNALPSCTVLSGVVFCDGSGDQGNYKEGIALPSGAQSIDFMWQKPTNPINGFIGTIYIGSQDFVGLDFYYDEGTCAASVAGGAKKEFSCDEWHSADFSWVAGGDVNIEIDDILIGATPSNYYWNIIWFAARSNSGQGWILSVDNIGAGAPPPISGYAPILTPVSPERNTETIVDFDAGFEVAGTVQIPTSNSNIYTDLVLTFRAPDSFLPAETYVIDIGELTSGQSYNYSATTTVPIISSGDNFFKVGYTILGSPYGGSFLNPPISEELLAFDDTWVKDSPYGAPAYLITPSIKPDAPTMEDCSGYSGIDKVMCEFRNFVAGAFLPSDDALNQIGATMTALKNKFPMNYAAAVQTTLSEISGGINDDAPISISILGNDGAVDTSFFSADIGGGITIGATIKIMVVFMALAIFGWWAVGYMHRILR